MRHLKYAALSLLFLAAGCDQRATEPPAPLAVTFTHTGDGGPEQAQFRLVNDGDETIDYLASAATVPILTYNAEKAPREAGCMKIPDVPQFSAYPLMHGE